MLEYDFSVVESPYLWLKLAVLGLKCPICDLICPMSDYKHRTKIGQAKTDSQAANEN